MTNPEIEAAIITALIIIIPVLIIISYWVYLINKETYKEITKSNKIDDSKIIS